MRQTVFFVLWASSVGLAQTAGPCPAGQVLQAKTVTCPAKLGNPATEGAANWWMSSCVESDTQTTWTLTVTGNAAGSCFAPIVSVLDAGQCAGGGTYVSGCTTLLNKTYQYFGPQVAQTYSDSGNLPLGELTDSVTCLSLFLDAEKDQSTMIADANSACMDQLQNSIASGQPIMVSTPSGYCCVTPPN